MKITIDTNVAKQYGLTKEQFFQLLELLFDVDIGERDKEMLLSLGYIRNCNDSYKLTVFGKDFLNKILILSSKSNLKSESDYKDIARAIIALYPDGFKPGTYVLWRGSVDSIANRIRLLEYKSGMSISKELAIKTVQEYINSFTDTQYMQTLPYFLYKNIVNPDKTIEWTSNFLSILESIKAKDNSIHS